ncbi:MAG: hypothetical protein GX959_00730 [Clostridiales bacterium]|jgi:hypothetical protein|nr:hypothetical protein [Clostridiales bacterium]
MSKKKRLEEQRRQEELERQRRTAKAKPTASWRHLSTRGPVPVAPPADFIQLTPIVQPIPLVPYSSQQQPLAMFDEDDDDYYY